MKITIEREQRPSLLKTLPNRSHLHEVNLRDKGVKKYLLLLTPWKTCPDYFKTLAAMRKLLCLGMILLPALSHGQVRYVPQFIQQEYVPQTDTQLLHELLKQQEASYNHNREHLYYLQKQILDAKAQTNDKDEVNILTKYFNKLENLKGKDYAAMGNVLREIELNMKRELVDNGNKLRQHIAGEKYVKVKSLAYVFSSPTWENENLITKIPVDRYVFVIEIANSLWCKIKYEDVVGYTLKSDLNL